VLYSERKSARERAEAEAQGHSFWTAGFDPQVRTKILYAADGASNGTTRGVFASARAVLLRSFGLGSLTGKSDAYGDFLTYVESCADSEMPNVIEALHSALQSQHYEDGLGILTRFGEPWEFETAVGRILLQHRVSFVMEQGQMAEFASKELHNNVVEPALTLLRGDKELASVEVAYQKALAELSSGDPGDASDAITDAATALQEMFRCLGFNENSLDAQAAAARDKGVLASYDTKLLGWIQADRCNKGDAHQVTTAQPEDAWLVVHVVGALILRLNRSSQRG
jgi:hypothetical protein